MKYVARILPALVIAGAFLVTACPTALLDDYEPNDTIAELLRPGDRQGNEPEKSWTATISPKGDVDFYRFLAEEDSGFGIPTFDELLTLTIRMVPPQAPDARDYDLFLYDTREACSTTR